MDGCKELESRRVRTGMKRILLILAAMMFVPVSLAERIPDRTWDNAVEELRQKLQFQTRTGDWVIVENSPEEGFSAGTTDGQGNFLLALCIPGTAYGASISSDGTDSLGTDYDDLDDQPVTLNWRSPNLTQRKQWAHLSLEEADSVTLVDILNLEETDAFLDRLTRHGSLNAVVTVSRSGRTKQATFSLDGAPSAGTVKACGQEQTPGPGPTPGPSPTPSDTTLYFPDYVDGDGWAVQLVLINVSATTSASVTVSVYGQRGQVVRNLFNSGPSLQVPSQGNRVLKSDGTGNIRRGWIEVHAETGSVSGLLTYRHIQTGIEVAVEPVALGNHFALFVEETSDIGTGMAIFKPEDSPTLELRIRDEAGDDPLDGTFVTWRDFNQQALTIPEWFDVSGVDRGFLRDFRGVLFIRSEDGSLFAPLGLRFGKKKGSLSAVPVITVVQDDESDECEAPNPFGGCG